MPAKRPPVRIHFKYNIDTGDIEEFIIDDNAPAASEDYHDKIAEAIASRLGHEPDISDAGPIRPGRQDVRTIEGEAVEEQKPETELETE